tara:strand:- start:328 stop:609 length:282 start_codon:yes stop_codon:yes gene_type:complete
VECGEIGFQTLLATSSCGVATTVKADLLAERDVHVERYISIGLPQRLAIKLGVEIIELCGGRIARVTRYGLGEQFWVICPHVSPFGPVGELRH